MTTQTVLADGLFDTINGLTGQGTEAIIGVIGAIAVFVVARQFIQGGMVAGLVACALGGIVWWGASSMDFFKDQAGETVEKSAPAEAFADPTQVASTIADLHSIDPAATPGLSTTAHVYLLTARGAAA